MVWGLVCDTKKLRVRDMGAWRASFNGFFTTYRTAEAAKVATSEKSALTSFRNGT